MMPHRQWRFKKTKHSDRKRLILSNDKLFRKLIHARDKVCQKTGKTENLQVAHFWSRSRLRVRWDMDNACLLNAGNHLWWAHKEPQEFRDFWIARLGQEAFEKLDIRARYVAPVDMEFLLFTNAELRRLCEEVE